MNLEIHKTLVLSIHHMKEDDSSLLPYAEDYGLVVYPMGSHGWMLYVKLDFFKAVTAHDKMSDFSGGFRKAIELAQENQCDWIRFDRDANTVDGLPEYEW